MHSLESILLAHILNTLCSFCFLYANLPSSFGVVSHGVGSPLAFFPCPPSLLVSDCAPESESAAAAAGAWWCPRTMLRALGTARILAISAAAAATALALLPEMGDEPAREAAMDAEPPALSFLSEATWVLGFRV